jgi:signal peptidase I
MNILIQEKENKEVKKRDSLDFNRRRKKHDFLGVRRGLIFVCEIMCVILLSYLAVRGFGIKTQNLGDSMSPTIGSNDYVLINKFVYKIFDPQKGDIVVFDPRDSHSSPSIKRVVGVPGDTVLIKDGILYVNNEPFSDEKRLPSIESGGLAENKIKLGKDEYFLLGDNRNNSEDSRFESIGNVSKSSIIGKVWLDVSGQHFGIPD